MESLTIYSRSGDLEAISRLLRERYPSARITDPIPGNVWSVSIAFPQGATTRTVTITHAADYDTEPNWTRQMIGLRTFYRGFPDADRKPRVIRLTAELHFSLGVVLLPGIESDDDPRLPVVYAVASEVDGVIFAYHMLLDAHGRILFCDAGAAGEDPDAAWPQSVTESPAFEIPLLQRSRAAVMERRKPSPAGGTPPSASRSAEGARPDGRLRTRDDGERSNAPVDAEVLREPSGVVCRRRARAGI